MKRILKSLCNHSCSSLCPRPVSFIRGRSNTVRLTRYWGHWDRDYVGTTVPEGLDDEESVYVIAMEFFLNDVGKSGSILSSHHKMCD